MRVVVAAALIQDGRVLAAQRTHPPAAAGRWELPGGAVEPGESELAALARECAEELGIVVEVGTRVGADVDLGEGRVLRAYVCRSTGEPTAHEHAALRWTAPAELDALDWLPADQILLDPVRELLRGSDGVRPRAPSSRPS